VKTPKLDQTLAGAALEPLTQVEKETTDWMVEEPNHSARGHLRLATASRDRRAFPPPVPATSSAADRTQAGNATRLVELHGDHFRYVPKWNAFIVWDGTVWQLDEHEVQMTELAKDVGREWLCDAASAASEKERDLMIAWGRPSLSASSIRDVIKLARGIEGIAIDHERLDANPWLFGVGNGVIDLRTGLLRAPDPRDLMTLQSSVHFDPTATAPRWEAALEEWFPNRSVRDYVQRLAGAALCGLQLDHVFVIHHGVGRNGKGTCVRALLNVFGPYAVTPHLSLLVQQRHGEHDTVKAELFRCRLAVASETERHVRLAEASIKNLTGGDRISCRKLYENPWEFDPSHCLWLQTNYLPEIAGRDRAIWSRVKVVPWEGNFEGSRERDLDSTLANEAPGILAWLVRGCLAWRRNGLAEPESVIRATLAYRQKEDTFVRFAVDARLEFGKHLSIPRETLNTMLDEWSATEGLKPSRGDFVEWLKENGARQERPRMPDGKQLRVWSGVGISPLDAEPREPGTSGTFT
jgi:putative DNA primase/helicase